MKNNNSAFTLLETVVGTALLAVMLLAFWKVSTIKLAAAKQSLYMGEEEDLRNFVRLNLDCTQTLKFERASCGTTAGYVSGYSRSGAKLVQSSSQGRTFGSAPGVNLKLTCVDAGNSIDFNAEVTRPGEAAKTIFDVPFSCKKCTPVSTSDPFTLSLGNGDANWLASYVANQANSCGITMSAYPFVQTYNASGGGFKWTPGTPEMNTLNKICNILGYENYVSSTCLDNQRGGVYPNGKCNWHTPNNNYLQYWNGASWVHMYGPSKYAWTWVSTITCSGLKN